MSITINVNINAPELAEAIQALAASLGKQNVTSPKKESTKKEQKQGSGSRQQKAQQNSEPKEDNNETTQEQEQEQPQQQSPKGEGNSDGNTVTLEEVRAKLAALSKDGKQAEVKSLINEFGASKLTEIPEEKYAELLEKAEEIA